MNSEIERKTIGAIEAFKSRQYGLGFPGAGTLLELQEWVTKVVATVPREYQESAQFSFGTVEEYDSHYATLLVWYSRPETDAELLERQQRAAVKMAERENAERQELARLLHKFGEK